MYNCKAYCSKILNDRRKIILPKILSFGLLTSRTPLKVASVIPLLTTNQDSFIGLPGTQIPMKDENDSSMAHLMILKMFPLTTKHTLTSSSTIKFSVEENNWTWNCTSWPLLQIAGLTSTLDFDEIAFDTDSLPILFTAVLKVSIDCVEYFIVSILTFFSDKWRSVVSSRDWMVFAMSKKYSWSFTSENSP